MVSGATWIVYQTIEQGASLSSLTQVEHAQSILKLSEQTESSIDLHTQIEKFQHRVDSLPTLEPASAYNKRSAIIASIAEDSGVRIDALQPETQQSEGRVSWLPISCDGAGQIDAIMKWMNSLEQGWPDTVVQSISIDSGLSDGLIRVRIVFRWYVLADASG